MTTAIPVPHIGPVVFVLDRTASMATRDCPGPEGPISRWEYAIAALRTTLVEMHARDSQQPVKLLTCGTTVVPIEGQALYEVVDITNGDASFAIGQAALEAVWHAGEGYVFIIADGPPAQDTRVGELVLGNDVAMSALFQRTYFLTVGEVDVELAQFAAHWPQYRRLEDATAPEYNDEQHGRLSDAERSEEYDGAAETADTEPPPADVTPKPAPKKRR